MATDKTVITRLFSMSLVLNALLIVMLVALLIHTPKPMQSSSLIDEASRFKLMPTKKGSSIFLGDSLTAEGPFGEIYGDILNRGVKGDTTNGVNARLGEIIRHQPFEVFLMIGINDLMRGKEPRDVASGIATITHTLLEQTPNTHLVVIALLPIDETRFGRLVTNNRIFETNKEIQQALSDSDADFFDFANRFIGKDGGLDPMLTYDGLHLTIEGYILWLKCLTERF